MGWHVPTDAEWTQLTNYVGDDSVAGGKLKEIGTTHWTSPNTGATNENGFTALPGGDRLLNGVFTLLEQLEAGGRQQILYQIMPGTGSCGTMISVFQGSMTVKPMGFLCVALRITLTQQL